MSQQLAVGRGGRARNGGGGGGRRFGRAWGAQSTNTPKAYKSSVKEIDDDTFNTGATRYAAQFGLSRKNVANYLQKTIGEEGYLVAQTVRTGKKQELAMPPQVSDPSDAGAVAVRAVQVNAIAKRGIKLDASIKRGFAVVYDQCSLPVRDKLEASDRWEAVQTKQLLHDLVAAIERICVGFDDHKQEVYNLVQSNKNLWLHMQDEKTSVPDYARDFKSLWETCESFGGSPGYQEGIVEGLLKDPTRVVDVGNPTAPERKKAITEQPRP